MSQTQQQTAQPDTVPVVRPSVGKQNALAAMAERFAIEPSRLMDTLRATIITGTRDRGASNEEVAAFIVVANQYGLNPFTREIHAFVDPRKGIVPVVGIDGWAKLVNEEPMYDGCEFVEEDDEKGNPIKTTCIMHVKNRSHPTVVTERFKECKRNTPPWNDMPHRMLRHRSFMQCARVAFSLSGLYDTDEARDIIGMPTVSSGAPADRVQALKAKLLGSKPTSEGQVRVPDPDAMEFARREQVAEEAMFGGPREQLPPAGHHDATEPDVVAEDMRTADGIDGPDDGDGDGAVTAADLADWAKADGLLWDKAKDMGLSKPAYGKAKTAVLGLAPTKSTPDQRLAFLKELVGGGFDRDGNRVPAPQPT